MWYNNKGKDNNIVLSSRVRLARNLAGYAFPDKLNNEGMTEVIEKIKEVFANKEGWEFVDFTDLKPVEKASMLERHIISREFAEKKTPSALIKNEEKSIYIMLMEEDHIRLQCVKAGMDIKAAADAVFEAEELIDTEVELAFSEKYGYLTHCPTNLGTGMRASVMLHLPAYTKYGGIRALSMQLSKLGMTIRGMNGEGSAPSAHLYQISNEVTLGLSEEETIAKLNEIVGKIAAKEWELREKMDAAQREEMTDRAMRNFGILRYARKLNAGEIVSMYSELRLAASMKLIDIPVEKLDEMLFTTMPNTLITENEEARAPQIRDKMRADKIRGILGDIKIGV